VIALSAVLAWKFPGERIATQNDELVEWSKGAFPTQEEIKIWQEEYESYLAVRKQQWTDFKAYVNKYLGYKEETWISGI